jgi:hypothetical protein
MALKILQLLICTTSLISLQGCFSLHSTTVHDNPPAQTTTVYQQPADGTVAVTTTH